MKNKFLYMAVTNDVYELPVYITDTVSELSYLLGVKSKTISEVLSRGTDNRKKRVKKKYLYKKVTVDE